MNVSVALLLVLVALVAGHDEKSHIAEITQECAAAHNIPAEKIAEIKATKDKSTIQPTEELKCFAKCAIDKGNFIKPDTGIDVEHLVKIGVSHGKDETKLRAKIEKCKSNYKGLNNCDESWALYSCFFSH